MTPASCALRRRRLAPQRLDLQVAVQMLENLQPRVGRVVSQSVETFETRANPVWRRPREIHARLVLDLGQLGTEALQPGLGRPKLGSHRERLASSQEAYAAKPA